MEVRTTPEVEALFSEYEKLTQIGNYRRLAKLYGSRLIAAGPTGLAYHSNNIITRWQFDRAMNAQRQQSRLTSMRIVRLSEQKISDQYALVEVQWVATFSKTDSQPFQFNISYIVRKKKHKAEIVMFIAHEDEKKILQGYGIIP